MKVYKIIWQILKDTLFKGVVAWCFSAILFFCTLTATSLFKWSWFVYIHDKLGTTVIVLIVLILLMSRILWVCLARYIALSADLSRTMSAEKLSDLLFECLSELNAAKHGKSEMVLEHMTNFIDRAKKLFDKVTDSNCCVSVKICLDDTESDDKKKLSQLIVRNVLRDSSHTRERDTAEYKNKEHSVFENTAYTVVINNIGKYKYCYICNDISSMGENYMNSSIGCYEEDGLPYKSEMVTSLRDYKDSKKFRGFLCVDSESKNVFDKKGLGKVFLLILADTLFGAIPNLRQPN